MRNLILFLFSFLYSLFIFSQNSNQLLGQWELEKVSYKKISATNDEEQEQFRSVFNTALYKQLNAKQRLDVYELEQLNERAEGLLKLFYQSQIEFEDNGAFYNRSKMSEQPTSGEYLQDKKTLKMEWETADKNELKLVKITGDVLVLKDSELGVTYYYLKTKTN